LGYFCAASLRSAAKGKTGWTPTIRDKLPFKFHFFSVSATWDHNFHLALGENVSANGSGYRHHFTDRSKMSRLAPLGTIKAIRRPMNRFASRSKEFAHLASLSAINSIQNLQMICFQTPDFWLGTINSITKPGNNLLQMAKISRAALRSTQDTPLMRQDQEPP
jgi:hypothetical protein